MIALTNQERPIVEDVLAKYTPADCHVFAFGSRVTHTHSRYSDLDLVFIKNNAQTLSLQEHGLLAEAFSLSDLTFFVDIVDYHDCSPDFQAIIDASKVML